MIDQDKITIDILRAEKRYNIFKTIILTIVVLVASAIVIWQVNSKVNQSHELVRCEAEAIYNAKDAQTFRSGLKHCLDQDVDKVNNEL